MDKVLAKRIYYNIFRFECFIRAIFYYPAYVLFHRPLISEISNVRNQDDIFREHLSVVIKQGKGTAASRIIDITEIFLLLTPWNLLCGFLHVGSVAPWIIGWVLLSILALIISIKADSPGTYLNQFKKQELKSQQIFNRRALRAFLLMIAIWLIFVISFAYFLSNSKG